MMESLQTGRTFGLALLAGLVAGGVLAGMNIAVVRPFTLAISDMVIENLLAEGEFDEEEFNAQLQSIFYSQLYGSIVIGLVAGAGLGGTFVVARIGMSSLRTALVAAGIAWFVLYVIPSVKYPPSPSTTFDPTSAGTYQALLAGYTAVSAISAVAIAIGFRKMKRKEKALGAGALYLVVVSVAFIMFPDYHNDDDSLLPQTATNAWRAAISLSMTVFWFSLGLICGLLWTYGRKNVDRGI